MDENPDDPRWGPQQARAYLIAARYGGAELLSAAERDDQVAFRHHSIGFFCGLYAALQALKNYDGKENGAIWREQAKLWAEIKGSAVYKIICDERHALGHGGFLDDGTPSALEPSWPATLFRHLEAGRELSAGVFDDWSWPDGEFQGKSLEEIVNLCWRAVSNWIDEIDAKSQYEEVQGSDSPR